MLSRVNCLLNAKYLNYTNTSILLSSVIKLLPLNYRAFGNKFRIKTLKLILNTCQNNLPFIMLNTNAIILKIKVSKNIVCQLDMIKIPQPLPHNKKN